MSFPRLTTVTRSSSSASDIASTPRPPIALGASTPPTIFGAIRARRVNPTDDLRRDEERDFVSQASIEKFARDRRAAFNQDALQRTTTEFAQHLVQITVLRVNDFDAL